MAAMPWGGVITFRSLRPDDLLAPGETFALDIPFVYTSYNAGFSEAIRLAGRNDTGSEALFVVSRIDAREATVRADSNLIDPQDRSGTTLYGNFVHNFDDFSNLSIILEDFNRDTRTTTADANLGAPAPGTIVTSFVEDILIDRWRVAPGLRVRLTPTNATAGCQICPWPDLLPGRHRKPRKNFENRPPARVHPCFRETHQSPHQPGGGGGEAQVPQRNFTTGDLSHQLTYGIEGVEYLQTRDPAIGVQTNLILPANPPATFPRILSPVKGLPRPATTLRIGAYLQDEITWGPVDLIAWPAIRPLRPVPLPR